MTHVVSAQISSYERRYTFYSEDGGDVVLISVPVLWDEKTPKWVRDRCKQGLVCSVVSTLGSPRTIRLKRVVVNDAGKLSDLDWDEVNAELEGEAALNSLINAITGAKKAAPRTYTKVFNKKVLDKKTPSVV